MRRWISAQFRKAFPNSYTSLVAQTVKHRPAMHDTQVRFLGQEEHKWTGLP